VKDGVTVTEFQPSKCHRHPALYIRWEEYQRPILDYHLEVGFKEFKDKIQVGFGGEDVQQLEDMSFRERKTECHGPR
jgi:hypothetical protein